MSYRSAIIVMSLLVLLGACASVPPVAKLPAEPRAFQLASDELIRHYPIIKSHHLGTRQEVASLSLSEIQGKWGAPSVIETGRTDYGNALFWNAFIGVLSIPFWEIGLFGIGAYWANELYNRTEYAIWQKGDYTIKVATDESKSHGWKWFYQGLDENYQLLPSGPKASPHSLSMAIHKSLQDSVSPNGLEFAYARIIPTQHKQFFVNAHAGWRWTRLGQGKYYVAFPIGLDIERRLGTYAFSMGISSLQNGKVQFSDYSFKDSIVPLLAQTTIRHPSGFSLSYHHPINKHPHDAVQAQLAIGAQLNF